MRRRLLRPRDPPAAPLPFEARPARAAALEALADQLAIAWSWGELGGLFAGVESDALAAIAANLKVRAERVRLLGR